MVNNMEVYCIKYAETFLKESDVFLGGNKFKDVPICFSIYLVKLGKRNILIDAGCDNILGFDMRKFYSPAFVLRQAEVTSKDITDVIITHAHHDHIEAVKHFENAVIHITQDEYENRRKYISNVATVNVFANEYLLTPQIKIVQWGGHTKGSAIVQIETDTITHIFAGDECYTDANIVRKISTGSSVNHVKSKEFIGVYSNDNYCVHTCHDISLKTERIL